MPLNRNKSVSSFMFFIDLFCTCVSTEPFLKKSLRQNGTDKKLKQIYEMLLSLQISKQVQPSKFVRQLTISIVLFFVLFAKYAKSG